MTTDLLPSGRAIALFSDGTGNSSAKLFKTNVWRLYEAVDLGPSAQDRRDQIAYYDNGVGTSAFRPLAMLGGIFGFGLERNVLHIYRYACRNYRPGPDQEKGSNRQNLGDEIYGFGFSRGAFTMRLVIAMIASQGLVPYVDERDLARKAKDAYRAFCAPALPRRTRRLAQGLRAVRNVVLRGWRKLRGQELYDPAQNYRPVIRFVGVWDTVAAYGGPIAEITRAIDDWVWPLSMPDYQLNTQVRAARHALALDDERDSFRPLLWDEVHEAELIAAREVDPAAHPEWIDRNRLQQVWFTGMHSDVGGGYPDESLSFVSLLWMLEEAKQHGLRTLDAVTDRYRALANSYGPLHDSRAGVGSYYRYQPRKIAAWMHPVTADTLSLRDPLIRDSAKRPKGLLHSCKVHESVIARIASGTDKYAPIMLPDRFEIVPPSDEGEAAPQPDSEGHSLADRPQPAPPLVDAQTRRALSLDEETARVRAEGMEQVWNLVWLRRLIYFGNVLLTLLLVAMPMWIARVETLLPAPVLTDGRTWIGGILRLVGLVLPNFVSPWIQTWADQPFYFLVLVVLIGLIVFAGNKVQIRLRDAARAVWDKALPRPPAAPPIMPYREGAIGRTLRAVRNSRAYQRTIQIFKWNILPTIFALIILLCLAWALLAIYTQTTLPGLERSQTLCRSSERTPTLENVRRDFDVRRLCNTTGMRVERGQRYIVTFEMVDPWFDGDYPATPEGLAAGTMRWGAGYAGVPLRRVVDAGYLQPLIEIRPADEEAGIIGNVFIYPLSPTQQGEAPSLYRAEFTAERSGELFLFANDSMLPVSPGWGGFDHRFFYERSGDPFRADAPRGNRGTACVAIQRADFSAAPPEAPASPICIKASSQRTAREQAARPPAQRQGNAVPIARDGTKRRPG